MSTEKKEAVNYSDYLLDPTQDVLVPMSTYVALTNIIQAVEKEHSTVYRTDKQSYYHNKTHVKLSENARRKIPVEKLAKNYYKNLDMDATNKTARVDRDELGSAAVRLMGEFRGIFEYNVDNGHGVLKQALVPEPESITGPKMEIVQETEDQGPTSEGIPAVENTSQDAPNEVDSGDES